MAQLTREFEIITKQVGNNYYLKAKIRLHNYSEEYIEDQKIALKIGGQALKLEKLRFGLKIPII